MYIKYRKLPTKSKSAPLSPPILLPYCRIAKYVDWLSIEPPGVGDPRDGAVGLVDDGGREGGDGGHQLVVIDCDLVRMSIGQIVNIMCECVGVVVGG